MKKFIVNFCLILFVLGAAGAASAIPYTDLYDAGHYYMDPRGSNSSVSWIFDITDDGNHIDYWDIYYGTYDGTPTAGATYTYDLDGNFLEKILPDDPQPSAQFGKSVAVGCGRIVVGSDFRDVGSNSNEGEAYIYKTPDVITAYDVADWNSY